MRQYDQGGGSSLRDRALDDSGPRGHRLLHEHAVAVGVLLRLRQDDGDGGATDVAAFERAHVGSPPVSASPTPPETRRQRAD